MQLNLKTFFERAERYFSDNEIVSREVDGSLFRYRYRDYCPRVRQLADALRKAGIRRGTRVATLGWNTYRHMELYFAVPCFGAVLHAVNIRLSDEHITYILDKAEDHILFVDPDLLPTVERLATKLSMLRHIVVMGEVPAETRLTGVTAYEDFLNSGEPDFQFGELDEYSPCTMCFTSATTGSPKGVVYSQRALYLHSMAVCAADGLGVAERDTILPVAPMFHVNAWGLPYAAVAVGAQMVLPGPHPRPADILDLIQEERVTFCAAAVTVGVQMYEELQQRPRDLSSLRELMLGGSATPAALMRRYREDYGISIYTAWGATECAPLATTTHLRRQLVDAGDDARIAVRERQGIPILGVELQVLNDDLKPVPWDDRHPGEIYVRGPWIVKEYYRDERSAEAFDNGWWKSGDIATVGPDGSLRLVDRVKDLIKSGGEWISSVDIENELMACPGVLEAAVVAAPDERWQERPVAFVVPDRDADEAGEDTLERWLAKRFAKWWLPDRYIFIDALPKTGVGKFDKRRLREQLKEQAA